LPRPLVIPKVMTLKTLADVRKLVEKHLPAETRQKSTWRHVAKCLDEAARGADTVHLVVALRLVLMLEGVECRPK
jgi:hypothetical protein